MTLRLTEQELRVMQGKPGKPKKRSKFHNVWTEAHGIKFQSKKEAKRYGDLLLLVKSGEITELTRQVRYKLIVNNLQVCTYVADFTYWKDGKKIVEDVKGYKTDIYKLKKKLMKAVYGVEIVEV